MRKIKKILAISILLVFTFSSSFLQESEKDVLLQRKKQIEKEIELTNRLLTDTRSKRDNSLQELKLLNAKIRKRNRLLRELNSEIDFLEEDIQDRTNRLQSLKGELEKIRKEYAELVYYAFKNRNSNLDLMYLLASDDVNQFYSRFQYLQQYKDYRLKSIKLIVQLKKLIEVEIVDLTNRRRDKVNRINKMLAEKAILVNDQVEIDNVVVKLKSREIQLNNDIKEKGKIKERLEKQISDIIKKEAKKKRYKDLTPEEKIISDEFATNKGRLPWPTEMGVITDRFGEHIHPVLNVPVRNHGIDITTVPGAKARAIFNGVVTKVFNIRGANSTIIIRHGNYFTVYQNLLQVYVRAGDIVSTMDSLGEVFTDNKKGESILHIEIWKEREKQNPEDWLSN